MLRGDTTPALLWLCSLDDRRSPAVSVSVERGRPGVIYSSVVRTILFLAALALPAWSDVKITKQADRIDVQIDGKPFTTFYFGPNTNKPYLHPLRAADRTI